ncbi:unnamed protein product [Bursaphelenchus okinawaensis]|uniref:MH1 domain-containing protein n=1 Tax=Bursaphelenchus okinawaensis TaxID=465554 RepID=A0A811KMS6_9BILA|nr:unnamed protein product [Bursaphelenchus okinawaensis]CAG9105440.1 unnamed protein product [Bursaphelenchus okinawaensis]
MARSFKPHELPASYNHQTLGMPTWPYGHPPPVLPKDSVASAINYLLSRIIAIPNRLALRSLERICKRMQSDPATKDVELNKLIQHVADRNLLQSPCIKVKSTRDGRLQVAGAKYNIFTILVRLYSYPGVEREHLTQSKHHEHGNRGTYVCINPDHFSTMDYRPMPFRVSVDYSVKKHKHVMLEESLRMENNLPRKHVVTSTDDIRRIEYYRRKALMEKSA